MAKAPKLSWQEFLTIHHKTNDACRKVLSRFGAFVRQSARSSLRSGSKPSAPGQPPRNKLGFLKAGILFSYDPQNRRVVIGPTTNTKGEVSHKLEFGRDKQEARPFMGPAMIREQSKLPPMWRDSIR